MWVKQQRNVVPVDVGTWAKACGEDVEVQQWALCTRGLSGGGWGVTRRERRAVGRRHNPAPPGLGRAEPPPIAAKLRIRLPLRIEVE
ncbi:hypothetical protein ACOMHN_053606 [Nucella lapillus]